MNFKPTQVRIHSFTAFKTLEALGDTQELYFGNQQIKPKGTLNQFFFYVEICFWKVACPNSMILLQP